MAFSLSAVSSESLRRTNAVGLKRLNGNLQSSIYALRGSTNAFPRHVKPPWHRN